MFLIVETRLNIALSNSVTSCFLRNPTHQYIKAMKIILQYLKESKKYNIMYKGE